MITGCEDPELTLLTFDDLVSALNHNLNPNPTNPRANPPAILPLPKGEGRGGHGIRTWVTL